MRTITIAVCPERNDTIVMPPEGYLAGVNSMTPNQFKSYQRPDNRPTLDKGFYHVHMIDLSQRGQVGLQSKIARMDILENPNVRVLADQRYMFGPTPVRRIFYGVYGLPPGGWNDISISNPDGSWVTQTWLSTMRRYPQSLWHLPLHAGGDLKAEPKKTQPQSKMPPRP